MLNTLNIIWASIYAAKLRIPCRSSDSVKAYRMVCAKQKFAFSRNGSKLSPERTFDGRSKPFDRNFMGRMEFCGEGVRKQLLLTQMGRDRQLFVDGC